MISRNGLRAQSRNEAMLTRIICSRDIVVSGEEEQRRKLSETRYSAVTQQTGDLEGQKVWGKFLLRIEKYKTMVQLILLYLLLESCGHENCLPSCARPSLKSSSP